MRSLLELVPPEVCRAPVACNGEVHVLGWNGPGEGLRAIAHDPTDEDVLQALGGTRPPCVALAALWHDYRLEPLLLSAMLTGAPGLLQNQTFATVGPPISVRLRRRGIYGLVEPLVDLPAPMRRVLAAEAAIAYSATDLLRTGVPDNTSSVRWTVRGLLRAAARDAFAVDEVDASQVWVTDDRDAPVLFVRARHDGGRELVLAGKVPVRWAALVSLGVEVVHGRRLVLDASLDPTCRRVRLAGYELGRRDPELSPFVVDVEADALAARIRDRLEQGPFG